MKQIFLLLAITFSCFQIQAQESDATWEETVNWLEDNISLLNNFLIDKHGNSVNSIVVIENEHIICKKSIKPVIKWADVSVTETLPLNKIKSTEIIKNENGNKSDKFILKIYFYSKVVEYQGTNNNGEISSYLFSEHYFYSDKLEDLTRVKNALNQIAYLNSNKIKNEKF
uniref:hypothetical protein n=1 Tax=Flavobacterium sp. TaxID=239 RepID=UPI00404A18F4